jgi:transposase
MGDIQTIKHLHYSKGWGKKRIARELGLSAKTVRRILAGESDGTYHLRQARPQPVIMAIEPTIRSLLEAEIERQTPRKQRLNAARIEELLRKEHDYTGSSASARRAVARVRQALADPLAGAMVPLTYAPGVDAQVDFLEGVADYPEGRRQVFFLLVRACYSARPFAYHAPTESQEALFEGLILAFDYFGGVFHHLWFDNLTPAVKRVLKGRSREMQQRFAAFAAHYGFVADFCGVGKGNEKGGVENGVRYFEGRVLSPVPTVADDDGLAAHLRVWMAEQGGRRAVGRERLIDELWGEEAGALIPLPARHFDACRIVQRGVSATSLVQDGTNFYSVPVRLAKGSVTLKRYAWFVELHDRTGLVASHARLYGRRQVSFQLAHYLPLLERKARAFDHAAPVAAVRATWPASYELLLRLLRARHGEAKGTREFIQVLYLHEHHPIDLVHEAVRQAMREPEPSLAVVRRLLEGLSDEATRPAPLPQSSTAHLPVVAVATGDVAAYAQLQAGVGS